MEQSSMKGIPARLTITGSLIRGFGAMICLALICAATPAQTAEFSQGNKTANVVSLEVPLGSYPGRGINLPITLRYSTSGLWRIGYRNTVYANVNGYSYRRSVTEALYAEHSTAGWTTSLNVPEIEWPKLTDRYKWSGEPTVDYIAGYTYRVARVWIHMPDGSTHELRKSDQVDADNGVIDMSGDFYAVDGSRMHYHSTGQSTGILYLADGTRYMLNGSTAQYIDRNGNTLGYDGSQWTDTMGRHFNMPWPANPSATDYTYSLPGINGSAITYVLKFRTLSTVFIPDVVNQTQKPVADYVNGLPPQPVGGSGLFNSGYTGDLEETDPGYERTFTYVVDGGEFGTATFDPVVLAEIDLPNGQSYHFYYNAYGELDKAIYPTGGYQRYQYGGVATIGISSFPYGQGSRGMLSRWISPSGSGSDEAQWTYSSGNNPLSVTGPDASGAPNGTRSDTYLFQPQSYWTNQFGYPDGRMGLPVDERIYAPASEGGAMLRRTLIDYQQSSRTYDRPSPGSGAYTAYRNARTTKTVSLMFDTGGPALAKTITYEYAANGYEFTSGLDRTASTESYFASIVDLTTAQTGDIASIQSGAPASRAETTYLNDSAYINRNILGLPTSVVLKDGNGNAVSKSESFYDESAYVLPPYNDFGADWSDPGPYRGNVTTGRRYLDLDAAVTPGEECPAGVCLNTHAYFDQAGNVGKATNERGIESLIEFPVGYKHAFATQATTAVPDPLGNHGSSTAFTSSSTFDYTTGLVLTTTDANGQVTTYSYQNDQGTTDPLNRLRKVTRPDGGWTKYSFGETLPDLFTKVETLQDSTRTVISYQYVDPLGRASRSFSSEGGGSYIAADTIYDQMGRVWKVSNPYRTTTRNGVADLSHTNDWTVSHYDVLSRVDSVTLPDSSTVQTSYQGIYTTVTDQAGRQRRQKTDALGRIVRVDEPNTSGSLGTFDAPTQPSFYQYNTQGNLIAISQGLSTQNVNPEDPSNYIQHRYFKYDALGRLTFEKQAEQAGTFTASDSLTGNSAWSRHLVYDETIGGVSYSGLLTTATDARNITTQFRYDNLNRIYQVNYSDGTPAVNNYYDQAVTNYFNKGHLTQASTAAVGSVPATSQSYNYDLMGRVANNQQTVGDQSYTMSYGYNLGGAMTSETYPSGRVVSYAFDDGARLSQVSSGSTVYANQFDYSTLQGLLKSVTLGNGGVETYGYNSRLQLSSLDLTKSGTQLQHYDYKYGVYNPSANTVDETKNTGQIARIEGFISTTKQWQQNFVYDSLGRLSSAREFRGDNGAQTWLVNYDYDVFGNRYLQQSQNSGNPINQHWVESADISQTTNRFTSSSVTYDDAGNITIDSKFRNLSFQYDANNRQKQSSDGTTTVVSVYDAGGQRVATEVGGSLTNVLVYDAGGKLLAEYGAAVAIGGTQYLFADHQGSPRAITNSSGAVVSRHDYAPFGEDIAANIGMRSGTQGYSQPDSVRQKYAGMESDDATGMDHTLWRQYDDRSGRWTSPDPYGGSMSPGSPQSFNRYAYVNNDPVNKVDPTGLMLSDIGVYQTNDPEEAQIAEHQALRNLQMSVNQDYARRHDNGTVAYYGNRASYSSGTYNILFGTTYSVSVSAEITGVDPQESSALTLPTDPSDYAMLAVILGEASTPGEDSWGPDEYGRRAYKNPSRKLSDDDVFGEMIYMVFVVSNRLIDWGQRQNYKSWKDVIEKTTDFVGYGDGKKQLNSLASADAKQQNRARLALDAIKSFHDQPIPRDTIQNFHYWKGIRQKGEKAPHIPFITMRGNATRFANTDFSVYEKRY
jgi:RHS repeat-associated protein